MNYKTYLDLANDIREKLSLVSPEEFDLVVGLPRSGMIPAYMISLFLNINCTDLNSFIANKPLKKGRTRKCRINMTNPHDAQKVLIIDDVIATGFSMKKDIATIPKKLRNKIVTMAVYSHEKRRDDVDIYFKHVPAPCLFEWNIFHHGIIGRSCLDIDGVLCIDPTKEQDDDGLKYKDFLKNAQPYILPSSKVHSLVTSRLEKYRPETEAWLKKHDVVYDHLIMMDSPTLEEREKEDNKSQHKAHYYKKSKTLLFIESAPQQAQEICKLTGKIVYCSQNNILYHPNYVSVTCNPRALMKCVIAVTKNILRPVKRLVVKHI